MPKPRAAPAPEGSNAIPVSAKRRRDVDEKEPVANKKLKPGQHPNPLARKYGHHVNRSTQEEGSAAVKKKIRDTERLLKNVGGLAWGSRGGASGGWSVRLLKLTFFFSQEHLPATVKVDLQRRLKALKLALERKQRSTVEEKLALKYKYVRFVEKKKVTRKITQLERALTLPDPPATTAADLSEQRARLLYTTHFPRDMAYIALFAGDDGSTVETDSDVGRKREAIIAFMRKAIESGAAGRSTFAVRAADVFGVSGKKEKW
ncbi:hypothetical protein BDK51DRAFT_40170, partial [Blyttiomyces helicus]